MAHSTERESPEYTQVFYNGAIEAVWTQNLISRHVDNNIPRLAFQENIIVAVRNFLNIEEHYLGVQPPFYVMLTMIGLKGYTMAVDPRSFPFGSISLWLLVQVELISFLYLLLVYNTSQRRKFR
jgi:hypothetical protein